VVKIQLANRAQINQATTRSLVQGSWPAREQRIARAAVNRFSIFVASASGDGIVDSGRQFRPPDTAGIAPKQLLPKGWNSGRDDWPMLSRLPTPSDSSQNWRSVLMRWSNAPQLTVFASQTRGFVRMRFWALPRPTRRWFAGGLCLPVAGELNRYHINCPAEIVLAPAAEHPFSRKHICPRLTGSK